MLTLKSKQTYNDRANLFNQLVYLINTRLSMLNTLKICTVVAFHGNTIDVRPMLTEIDGNGNQIEQSILYGIPILQIQGGTSGLKIEYKENDIVLCAFCDKDIQSLVRSKKTSAPTTDLITPLNSGICIGAVLFNEATIYIEITDKIYLNGNTEVSGTLDSDGYTTGGFTGIDTSFVDAGGATHLVKKGLIIS